MRLRRHKKQATTPTTPSVPVWLQQQREQLAESQVRLPNISPSYPELWKACDEAAQAVREHVPASGLTDADVRRIEHPGE